MVVRVKRESEWNAVGIFFFWHLQRWLSSINKLRAVVTRLNDRSRVTTLFEKLAHWLWFMEKIGVKKTYFHYGHHISLYCHSSWYNGEDLLPLKHFFDQRTVKEPKSDTLLRLAELVLTLNCFSFGDNFFKQTNGVTMGTKMGPSYANLLVGFVEHQFFSQWLVWSVTPSKIKKRNHSINQVKKLWYERWLIYKQPSQDLDLCGNSFARYLEKCSTQIYRALYGDAMLVPIYMGTNMAAVK